MKLKTSLLALSIAMLGTTAAHAAAPAQDLIVKGTIDVPACTVVAADNGVYDYGKISPTLIKSGTTTTPLTKMEKAWTVSCDAETYMSFKVTDNRSDSASSGDNTAFGLGKVNETGKLGYYSVTMQDAQVDGKKAQVYATQNAALTGTGVIALSQKLNKLPNYTHGWANESAKTQMAGKNFTANMVVEAVLGGTETMGGALKDAVELDGSATLTFAFGL
ncbi:DUF1120 domain-containing protein [Burkholderia oklahomensis]|uniref:DUF1120 domain-containing protein n=1 Tax=Burkholderia oklahomensis TaxID=342113 RepID=UPI00016A82F0|nr:DUF1120 domain-containing protein [Burkholderia oklahomensis]AJX35747.1 hypothetical protein BG90_4135 [Burkholderia oklahomensis C6786]AOI47936.1 hypothetical protein WI23_18625 [Burkholderia oklahomensis C6786]KUY50268.1 hypothetical protein WI23_03340 [Burkholderia oklahomensis C6786]MBI0363964.1 DUF1120 domain-containing protein [Burkholderia oklahomensis]SUY28153.1 Protein of uncharacterised function (DUF1120) [Burkholderia oklahomensis]